MKTKSKALSLLLLASACAACFSLAACDSLTGMLPGGPADNSTSSSSSSSSSEPAVVYQAINDTQHKAGDVTENHTFTESNVVAATCEDAGSKTLTCDKCSFSMVVEIPALGHDFTEPVFTWTNDPFEGWTAEVQFECENGCGHEDDATLAVTGPVDTATCAAAGTLTYTATVTLDGEVFATNDKVLEIAQKDHYVADYSKDDIHHWKEIADTCECADVEVQKVKHDWQIVTDLENATTTYTCKVCQHVVEFDYVVNSSNIVVGENVLHLATPKEVVIAEDAYIDFYGNVLEYDEENEVYILDWYWDFEIMDYVYVTKPESELVEGEDYDHKGDITDIVIDTFTATFVADKTGNYTFSLPTDTYSSVRISTQPTPYNQGYASIGCTIFNFHESTTATMTLAEGDEVTLEFTVMEERTDDTPDDEEDTAISYGGKKIYTVNLTVSYEEDTLPGASAEDPIVKESTYLYEEELVLAAGASTYYSLTCPTDTTYEYRYFEVDTDSVEIYVNGSAEKLALTESENGYVSEEIRLVGGDTIVVQFKNPTEEELTVLVSTSYRDTSISLKLNENVLTIPAADLFAGVNISFSANGEDKFRVTFDETSFKEAKVSTTMQVWDSTNYTFVTKNYGYANEVFTQYTAEGADNNGYSTSGLYNATFKSEALIDAETVTLIITVDRFVVDNSDDLKVGENLFPISSIEATEGGKLTFVAVKGYGLYTFTTGNYTLYYNNVVINPNSTFAVILNENETATFTVYADEEYYKNTLSIEFKSLERRGDKDNLIVGNNDIDNIIDYWNGDTVTFTAPAYGTYSFTVNNDKCGIYTDIMTGEQTLTITETLEAGQTYDLVLTDNDYGLSFVLTIKEVRGNKDNIIIGNNDIDNIIDYWNGDTVTFTATEAGTYTFTIDNDKCGIYTDIMTGEQTLTITETLEAGQTYDLVLTDNDYGLSFVLTITKA